MAKKAQGARRPQRLYKCADVCDTCGAVDSFRVVGRWRNVTYLRCASCGRRATRITLTKERNTDR